MEEQKQVAPATEGNATAPAAKPSTGNTNALFTYVLGWLTGLIFLLTEKEDDFIRFHAAQSIVVFGLLSVIGFIPLIGWMLLPFTGLIGLILWILLMINAYNGERYKLPVVGDWAESLKGKF